MYIEHLTLTTGHTLPRRRGEVGDDILAIMVPWLRDAIAAGEPVTIPAVDGCQALALVDNGALVVTVYGPKPDIGPSIPLVSFGVCARSRAAPMLWSALTAMPGVVAGIKQPAVPWCAVVLHPTLIMYPQASEWLGDFEHVIAWAWVTRNPELRSV